MVAKVSRVLEILKSLYYLVAPSKTKYLMVTPGATIPPEPLLVVSLPVLRPKTKVQWLGF